MINSSLPPPPVSAHQPEKWQTPNTTKSKSSSNKTPNLKHPISPQISTTTSTTALRCSPRLRRIARMLPPPNSPTTISLAPASPQLTESKRKRKIENEQNEDLETKRASRNESKNAHNASDRTKKRVYHKKVVYDGGEFSTGDDVYVKRREDAASDDEDPVIEECRVCFKPAGKRIMIECDECLNWYHLRCLKPPLKEVPVGSWICNYCEARKSGKMVEFPEPPKGMKRARTAREKLILSGLWAARIESLWKDVDGNYWFRACWYIIPEETSAGRQPHNLRREHLLPRF